MRSQVKGKGRTPFQIVFQWFLLPFAICSSLSATQEPFRQLKITFVTGNAMKANEMNRILADHGATKGPTPETSLVDLNLLTVDLPEIQEVDTIAIAKDKALLAAQLANGPCLVEDTSLKFHALGGMPGPYIKVRKWDRFKEMEVVSFCKWKIQLTA